VPLARPLHVPTAALVVCTMVMAMREANAIWRRGFILGGGWGENLEGRGLLFCLREEAAEAVVGLEVTIAEMVAGNGFHLRCG
jgi:hypothetical protein